MLAVSATEVRREWGGYIDTIVREKPIFVKRSRDYFACMNIDTLRELTKNITFELEFDYEETGEAIATLKGYDFVSIGRTEEEAVRNLIGDFREYVKDYFDEIEVWSRDKHRAGQIVELLKVCVSTDEELIGSFICHQQKI